MKTQTYFVVNLKEGTVGFCIIYASDEDDDDDDADEGPLSKKMVPTTPKRSEVESLCNLQ